ncbi:MAG: lipoprotein insertase outer membrane protein LolB [Pedobacter sp.]
MTFYRLLRHLLPLLLLTACATISTPPIDYSPGAVVETLSSSVSISIHTTDRSMGGHGYLVFRRPDQVHLVLLSPFGTTMLEAFALGEQITLVYPSRMTVYSGRFDELPEKGGLQGWRMMRWVMDSDSSNDKRLNSTVERMGKLGFTEKVTFVNGLVTSKVSPGGDQVYYDKYAVISGVPVATEVEMRNALDDRIRLALDEPEVNTPLDAAAFTPQLDGMTILPLSEIQGI